MADIYRQRIYADEFTAPVALRTGYRIAARRLVFLLHLQEVLFVEIFQGHAVYAPDYFEHYLRYAFQIYHKRSIFAVGIQYNGGDAARSVGRYKYEIGSSAVL